ncbi:hypothetical protein NDU88_004959 [Pleurodeles waltl]|uniref:Uncharacterized protein n=1 Tax=Pleurodeles waltl TaxID=8319 RepID=A0AAV7RK85_PLEWA|nr:hypothetical protein NDU88_004959 [Pleurodeles waltl]
MINHSRLVDPVAWACEKPKIIRLRKSEAVNMHGERMYVRKGLSLTSRPKMEQRWYENVGTCEVRNQNREVEQGQQTKILEVLTDSVTLAG